MVYVIKQRAVEDDMQDMRTRWEQGGLKTSTLLLSVGVSVAEGTRLPHLPPVSFKGRLCWQREALYIKFCSVGLPVRGSIREVLATPKSSAATVILQSSTQKDG